ncbi:MAG: regulatory protein RecX [Candidatus Binatia bacterium]
METRKPRSRSTASEASGRAWDRAIRLLAVHDRSEQEIRSRLAASGESATTIAVAVRRLRHFRYLDDRRFALGVAEQAMRRGYGSEYVRAQLEHKAVAEHVIEQALHASFEDEAELARRALTRQFPEQPRQPAERAKAARFLLRRGFPEAVVFAILDEAC